MYLVLKDFKSNINGIDRECKAGDRIRLSTDADTLVRLGLVVKTRSKKNG